MKITAVAFYNYHNTTFNIGQLVADQIALQASSQSSPDNSTAFLYRTVKGVPFYLMTLQSWSLRKQQIQFDENHSCSTF